MKMHLISATDKLMCVKVACVCEKTNIQKYIIEKIKNKYLFMNQKYVPLIIGSYVNKKREKNKTFNIFIAKSYFTLSITHV